MMSERRKRLENRGSPYRITDRSLDNCRHGILRVGIVELQYSVALDLYRHSPAATHSMHSCRLVRDRCMLGTRTDRESSRGTVGNSIHIDT